MNSAVFVASEVLSRSKFYPLKVDIFITVPKLASHFLRGVRMWSWLSVALSGYISLSAAENRRVRQSAVFKILSLFMLLVIVWNHQYVPSVSLVWISVGLVTSAISDWFYTKGAYPKVCFIGFMVAQIAYSFLFWSQLSSGIVWWLPAMLLALGVVCFFLLLPKIDRFIFPVVLMGVSLLLLNWAAGEVWLSQNNLESLMGFTGTLMLTLSAVLLAIRDYKLSFCKSRYFASGSYLIAHSLISASLVL